MHFVHFKIPAPNLTALDSLFGLNILIHFRLISVYIENESYKEKNLYYN